MKLDFCYLLGPLKKGLFSEGRGGMLCARSARTQHTVPVFFRLPFFQGSLYSDRNKPNSRARATASVRLRTWSLP
jgi:hypothetical protein